MVSISPSDDHDTADDLMDVDCVVVRHVCTSYGFVPLRDELTELNQVNAVMAVIYHLSGVTLDGKPSSGLIAFPIPDLIEFSTQAVKDIAQSYCGAIEALQSGRTPVFVPLIRPMDDAEFQEGIERLISDGDTDVG